MNAFTTFPPQGGSPLPLIAALGAFGTFNDLAEHASAAGDEETAATMIEAASEHLDQVLAIPTNNLAAVLEKVKAIASYFAGGQVDVDCIEFIKRDLESILGGFAPLPAVPQAA